MGGGAAIRRMGFRGARHRAEGCRRLLLLRVALGGERDRVREEVGSTGHSLCLLLGWRRGHYRRWPWAWPGAQWNLVHSDIANEDRQGHNGFRSLQGDLGRLRE